MSDDFVIRFQFVDRETGQVFDWADLEIPERVQGISSTKTEAPFVVAQRFFHNLKMRISR